MFEPKSLLRVGQAMSFYAFPQGLAVTSLLMVVALLSNAPIPFTLTQVVLCGVAPERSCPCLYEAKAYSSDAIPFFGGMTSYPSGAAVTLKRRRSTLCWMSSYPSGVVLTFMGRCHTRVVSVCSSRDGVVLTWSATSTPKLFVGADVPIVGHLGACYQIVPYHSLPP